MGIRLQQQESFQLCQNWQLWQLVGTNETQFFFTEQRRLSWILQLSFLLWILVAEVYNNYLVGKNWKLYNVISRTKLGIDGTKLLPETRRRSFSLQSWEYEALQLSPFDILLEGLGGFWRAKDSLRCKLKYYQSDSSSSPFRINFSNILFFASGGGYRPA